MGALLPALRRRIGRRALVSPALALSGALLCGSGAAAAATAPASGRMWLVVQHAVGSPPFAPAGAQIVVRGIVIPYVAGQRVSVTFRRDGRVVQATKTRVVPVGNGAGQFHIPFSSAAEGMVRIGARHEQSAALRGLTARSVQVRFLGAHLAQGNRGESVRFLQQQLAARHYAVPRSGVFDEATGMAVMAFRKLAGLPLSEVTDSGFFERLGRGGGAFHVRYRHDGRHFETDLTHQVLAEIEPHGRVRAIFAISSGKPSTPTVIGRFKVYLKTAGINSKGMVDSNYFIAGYAIHGYAEVPPYPASHGCLRVPVPDAASIFAWARLGTPVDVYYESGGGSRRVSGRAGP